MILYNGKLVFCLGGLGFESGFPLKGISLSHLFGGSKTRGNSVAMNLTKSNKQVHDCIYTYIWYPYNDGFGFIMVSLQYGLLL